MLIYIMLVTVAKIKQTSRADSDFLCPSLFTCAGRAAEIDKLGIEYCTDRLLVKLLFRQIFVMTGEICCSTHFWLPHVEPSQTPLTNCSVLPRVLPWDSAARGRASSAFTLGVGIAEDKA